MGRMEGGGLFLTTPFKKSSVYKYVCWLFRRNFILKKISFVINLTVKKSFFKDSQVNQNHCLIKRSWRYRHFSCIEIVFLCIKKSASSFKEKPQLKIMNSFLSLDWLFSITIISKRKKLGNCQNYTL